MNGPQTVGWYNSLKVLTGCSTANPEKEEMPEPMVVRGRYVGRTFIPDEPLPDAEGSAELIITPSAPRSGRSVADAFGTASVLRSAEEILAQIRADRDDWGDR
jgi:hypothetical protein